MSKVRILILSFRPWDSLLRRRRKQACGGQCGRRREVCPSIFSLVEANRLVHFEWWSERALLWMSVGRDLTSQCAAGAWAADGIRQTPPARTATIEGLRPAGTAARRDCRGRQGRWRLKASPSTIAPAVP